MSETTPPLLIDEQAQFDELCEHIRSVGVVAYDTEFVSEHTYLPELCLLQLATPERAAAVDPFRVHPHTPIYLPGRTRFSASIRFVRMSLMRVKCPLPLDLSQLRTRASRRRLTATL